MNVQVEIWNAQDDYMDGEAPTWSYVVDMDDDVQRRTLAAQIRSALEAGQVVTTFRH